MQGYNDKTVGQGSGLSRELPTAQRDKNKAVKQCFHPLQAEAAHNAKLAAAKGFSADVEAESLE